MAKAESNRLSNLYVAIKAIVFGIAGAIFVVDYFVGFIAEKDMTTAHVWMAILVFYDLVVPFFAGKKAKKYACFKWKYAEKNYKECSSGRMVPRQKRNVGGVVAIWIALWLAILATRLTGLLTWDLFMVGACVLSMLNVWFVWKHCWLSTYIMKKSNCCADCSICGWDAFMFGSAFILCPWPNEPIRWINIGIFIVSFGLFMLWEMTYIEHPERFSKATNLGIRCFACMSNKCQCHK